MNKINKTNIQGYEQPQPLLHLGILSPISNICYKNKIDCTIIRRNMEEKYEKMLNILENWMNKKGISKPEQIKYYKKLISVLESKKVDLKYLLLSTSLSSLGAGLGIGSLLSESSELVFYLSFLLILSGVVITFPAKESSQYLKDYEEIEEKRELIKKWWQEKKN